MKDLKTAAGSWARAFLVAVLSLAAAGVTDRHANVLCTKKAVTSSYEEVLQGPFGKATVSWSKCPLITEPLSVDMSKAYGNAEMLNDFVKSLNVRQTIMDKIEG